MSRLRQKQTFLVLDRHLADFQSFHDALAAVGAVVQFTAIDELLTAVDAVGEAVVLLDTASLQEETHSEVSRLIERRRSIPMGLITAQDSDHYLTDIRRWGLLQVFVKQDPLLAEELVHFLGCIRDASRGFGLHGYLHHTMEMYNVSIATVKEKNEAVEKVINHFATSGFEIHELFDVRLILEEATNNALFHAFRTPTGEEKYNLHTLARLDAKEKIRVEYGNSASLAGFSVTDNAGTLRIQTILDKLERQLNREGLFDSSGRGLYLSRMLSSSLVINLEEQRRTQMIALFDKRRHMQRPKPFMVNFIGRDTFSEWRLDPDFD